MASIAIIIGLSINLVGIILVTGLLTIPALIAGRVATSLKAQLLLSPVVATFCSVLGVSGAFVFDLPPGACIVMTCGIGYLVTLFAIRR
jgi:ABC-type Mn2+/Zn2+ transport system permease subunit